MKSKSWLHILLWCGLYFFWVMVFQKRALAFSHTATIEFCYLIFIAANFYFNVYYNVPKFLYRKKYVEFTCTFLAGICIAALLRVPLATFLNKHYFLVGKSQPAFSELFLNSFLNIFIWAVGLVAAKLTIDRFRFQQYLDEIAKQKEQAELDFLNAQFNPHFLFNSINSIYGHIDKHNTVARNMLLTFSDMLRYQLYDCNSNNIAIEKEMSYVKNYVELQKVRNENVEVCLNVDETVKGFSVAPLLFIAFIENSFKYAGENGGAKKSIHIIFKKENDVLCFKCCNTKGKNFMNNIEHKGIGINNAKRRLALLYAKRHLLEIKDETHFYEVSLKLQLL